MIKLSPTRAGGEIGKNFFPDKNFYVYGRDNEKPKLQFIHSTGLIISKTVQHTECNACIIILELCTYEVKGHASSTHIMTMVSIVTCDGSIWNISCKSDIK